MKDKKVLILIVLGIGAAASLIYGVIAPSKRRGRVYTEPKPSANKAVYRPAEKIIPTKRRAKRTEFDSWGESPLIPKNGKIAEGPALGGIMWNEKNPKAVIGDRMVSAGEKFGDYTVIKIEKNRVILNDGAEELILKLGE